MKTQKKTIKDENGRKAADADLRAAFNNLLRMAGGGHAHELRAAQPSR
jgi:transposase